MPNEHRKTRRIPAAPPVPPTSSSPSSSSSRSSPLPPSTIPGSIGCSLHPHHCILDQPIPGPPSPTPLATARHFGLHSPLRVTTLIHSQPASMPVPVPRRGSPPPNSPTIANAKKHQLAALQSPVPLRPATSFVSQAMNGLVDSSLNGHATHSNGTTHRRRRRSKKHDSTGSLSSNASDDGFPTPSASDRSSSPSSTSGAKTPKSAGWEDVSFEEWTGIMKRVVDEWEIPRKVLHSSIGFGVLFLYSGRPENVRPVIYALSGALAVIAPVDALRLRNRRFERVYEKVLGFLMRESERHTTNGVIWYLVGVIYVLALLPRDIAVMAILILSWCDTAASTFGRLYGRRTWPLPRQFLGLPLAPRKSVAGSVAAILTGAIVAIGFWGWAVPTWQGYSPEAAVKWGQVAWKWSSAPGQGIISGSWPSLIAIGLATGIISSLTEALDLGSVDDNLSLPIISGTVLWGLSKLADLAFSLIY